MKNKYLRKLDIKLVDGEFENLTKEQIRNPEQVFELFKKIKDEAQETALSLYLDEELRPKLYSVLSIGSSDATLFDETELYRHVVVTRSKTFVVIHNHPKGDPKPSNEDKLAMAELTDGAKKLKLTFLDFIIVGADSYWSMFEEGDGGDYTLGAV